MKRLSVCIIAIILSACGGPASRNKWQKKEDFINRRPIYYNEFVQSGGMKKDDDTGHNSLFRKEIQNSLNQGRLLSSQ